MDTTQGGFCHVSHNAKIVKVSQVVIEGNKIHAFDIVQVPLGEDVSKDIINKKDYVEKNHVFKILRDSKVVIGDNYFDILIVDTSQH